MQKRSLANKTTSFNSLNLLFDYNLNELDKLTENTVETISTTNEQDALYIVMPAYNEEANIEAVVRDWYPILAGKDASSRLIVADAGSTDATHDILLNMQEELPQLEILTDSGKKHGPKLIALYNNVVQRTERERERERTRQTAAATFAEVTLICPLAIGRVDFVGCCLSC